MKTSQARDAFPKMLQLYGCGFIVLHGQAEYQTKNFSFSSANGPDKEGNYTYEFGYDDGSCIKFTESGANIHDKEMRL